MSSNQPTNYGDIRESFALALETEAPEAKKAVLQTVDDAVANHSDQLHFPHDGPAEQVREPYSAFIVYEGGSGTDTGIVAHHYDEQILVVEYEDSTTTRYPFGTIEEINPVNDKQ